MKIIVVLKHSSEKSRNKGPILVYLVRSFSIEPRSKKKKVTIISSLWGQIAKRLLHVPSLQETTDTPSFGE